MNQHRYTVIIVLLTFIFATTVNGQVTIGDGINPASYSIVQVEGKNGGLRLPRMSATQRDALKSTLASNEKAEGLVIYNTTDNKIEFWNGSKWIAMGNGLYDGKNGLTTTTVDQDSKIELGGVLIKNTSIDLKDYNLDLDLEANSEFKINTSSLKPNKVSLTLTNKLEINTDALNIDMQAKTIGIKAKQTSVNDVLLVNDEGVTVKKKFKYTDGTEVEGYLLTSDAKGEASWAPARPFGSVVRGALSDNSTGISAVYHKDITSTSLVLPPGQWMILAKSTIQTVGAHESMYYWMSLHNTTSPDDFYIKTGKNPEFMTKGTVYCTPSLVYFLDTPTTVTLNVCLSTDNKISSTKTTSDFGGSYFYAVRIDASS